MADKARKGTSKAKNKPPAPDLKHPLPGGLGDAGQALWTRIVADLPAEWQFDSRELHLLTEASILADAIAELDAAVRADGAVVEGSRGQRVAHPALAESRQLRGLQLRQLSALELDDPVNALRSVTPGQAHKRKAAAASWARANRRLK